MHIPCSTLQHYVSESGKVLWTSCCLSFYVRLYFRKRCGWTFFLGTSRMNLNYNGKLGPLCLREFVHYTYWASGINDYIFVIRERMIYFLDRHFIRSYHSSRKSLQCRTFWKFLLSFLCTIHHSTDENFMQMRLIAFVFYYKK